MVIDLPQQLIQATVQLEQPLGNGTRTVGTGFLISAPGPDGQPRTLLITANHVLDKMPGPMAHVGYRVANKDGSWTYAPQTLRIRDACPRTESAPMRLPSMFATWATPTSS